MRAINREDNEMTNKEKARECIGPFLSRYFAK